MIKTILWDVDGTLLDFGAAERAAMTALYREFGRAPARRTPSAATPN